MDCIFCKIAAGKISAPVVFQSPQVLAFRDINPQAPTHILVIPKKHLSNLTQLSDGDAPLLSEIHQAISAVARLEKIEESGFRTVVNTGKDGGQSVDHLHYHVIGGRPLKWPPG